MSNVLSEEKQKQVIALGQLGGPLRRIEKETGVRRETAAGYLRAAGIALRPPRGWGRKPPAKPAKEVTTDPEPAKPANGAGVTADSGPAQPARSPAASACAPYHELIEIALARGRNAMAIWQNLVDQHGFAGAYESVKRYVRRIRASCHADAARPSRASNPGPIPSSRSQRLLASATRVGRSRRTRGTQAERLAVTRRIAHVHKLRKGMAVVRRSSRSGFRGWREDGSAGRPV